MDQSMNDGVQEKIKRYLWVKDGEVTFYDVTYDGVTATAEKAKAYPGTRERFLVGNAKEIPVDPVRLLNALTRIIERRKQRRSAAAKKAAVTRAIRKTERFKRVVKLLQEGGMIKPRSHCVICGKRLTDPVSLQRGIGPECWSGISGLLMKAKPVEQTADPGHS